MSKFETWKEYKKVRKTVPFDTSTRVHRDEARYDKRERQKWKQDLRRDWRQEERMASSNIPDDLKRKFFSLANQLSPENLTCDGECSPADVRSRRRQIMTEWSALERRVGRKVSIDEIEEEQIRRWRNSMDDEVVASELVRLARDVFSMEFPNQKALDKYLKSHPKADKSNHRVVKDKRDETPDEVEVRLKKQQGPAYKTQTQRSQEGKKEWDERIRKLKDEKGSPKKDADPKMPPEIGGKKTNEKALGAVVGFARDQKEWAEKKAKDDEWMKSVSPMSREMVQKYAGKSVEDTATEMYRYYQMRHDMGVSSKSPGAYREDINIWKEMTETGKHPSKSSKEASEKSCDTKTAFELVRLAREFVGMPFGQVQVEEADGFRQAFKEFLAYCQKVSDDYMNREFPSLQKPVMSAMDGSKYIRVVRSDSSQRSAHVFVDKTNGNVLKPAGWNAPAKHARANVFDKSTWKNVGAYGAAYLRGGGYGF